MNTLSDFTQARWREWMTSIGYEEKDAPYLWCLDALARFPQCRDSLSIKRFMEVWRIGNCSPEALSLLVECRETIGNTGKFPGLFERLNTYIENREHANTLETEEYLNET